MKTLTYNQKTYGANQPSGMSDTQFKSMVLRNGMTPKNINALKSALGRGKELTECQK